MEAGDTWMLMESAGAGAAPWSARFESIGRCLPDTVRTTADVMAGTRHGSRVDLQRLTGIAERRVVGEGEDSFSLAVGAARDCLAHSRHLPGEIEVLVNCSISRMHGGLRQQFEPPLSREIAEEIGASASMTFDVSNACAGMLTGVFLLNDMIRLGDISCGMVVSGEYISHLATSASEHVRSVLSSELASLTLGDAGAAAIVERATDGSGRIDVAGFSTISKHARLCLAYPSRSGPGGMMYTKAQSLQKAAIQDAPPLIAEALVAAGLHLGQVGLMIPHQTSVRAIRKGVEELRRVFGEVPGETAITVDRFGNTASTTHFVALYEYLSAGRVDPDEVIMLVSLASGLEVGVLIFTPGELVRSNGNGR